MQGQFGLINPQGCVIQSGSGLQGKDTAIVTFDGVAQYRHVKTLVSITIVLQHKYSTLLTVIGTGSVCRRSLGGLVLVMAAVLTRYHTVFVPVSPSIRFLRVMKVTQIMRPFTYRRFGCCLAPCFWQIFSIFFLAA